MIIRLLRFVLRFFGLDVVRVLSAPESAPEDKARGGASGFEPLRGHYQPPVDFYRPPSVRLDNAIKVLDVVEFNASVEPQAVAFLRSYLEERGPQRVSVLCTEVAFRFDVSVETAKRWIRKHCAESAEFVIERGVVDLRRS
jgi:hypothetical protein